LQDQLYGRDLPRLVRTLGLPVRTALLKGRASYLCLHRLEMARHDVPQGPATARTLARIERWAPVTRTGDLAELPGLDERSPVIPLVTSTRENCLGSECPQYRACHVNLARREALAADVVVINHHLFFADLAIRESGMAELLPAVRVVVFDEAHQLNETGIQFLGQQLGSHQLLDFARDLLAAGLQQARGLADWQTHALHVETAARELRLAAGQPRAGSQRLRWADAAPDGLNAPAWSAALARVQNTLAQTAQALDTVSEIAPDFVRLQARAQALAQLAARFAGPADADAVRWLDVGLHTLRLVESPLDIARVVREKLLRPPEAATPPPPPPAEPSPPGLERPRAWVFVSATLGDDERLTWFTKPCGLQDAEVLRIGSPFDYGRQAALYVPAPAAFPRPADPDHPAAVARLAGDAALRLRGRTMVLTTTLRALRAIGSALAARFEAEGQPLQVLVQGDWPKRELMARFQAGSAPGQPGCVLVASASFWEGVDMPGDALQCVVIDKLPFPPPGDPLVEARCRRIEAAGRSAFADYSLPEAAVALKQGAGRLIRRETDTGLLVIADTRLIGMGYGRRLLGALPPMRRLGCAAEWEAALATLAQALTAPAVAA
ncbi:MAG: ATP-dependent DNA helicase, partial [Comamonadaceae bacterium]|nr:ATP-dependent DNA helicase [Comamonadaceae bacterium]